MTLLELRKTLARLSEYHRGMMNIFRSEVHETGIVRGVAIYNYHKGAYEASRKAWWIVVEAMR